jgi:hypothetical protein
MKDLELTHLIIGAASGAESRREELPEPASGTDGTEQKRNLKDSDAR